MEKIIEKNLNSASFNEKLPISENLSEIENRIWKNIERSEIINERIAEEFFKATPEDIVFLKQSLNKVIETKVV